MCVCVLNLLKCYKLFKLKYIIIFRITFYRAIIKMIIYNNGKKKKVMTEKYEKIQFKVQQCFIIAVAYILWYCRIFSAHSKMFN